MNDLASSDFLRLGGVVVRNELAKQLREPHMPGAAPYPALRATFSPLRAGLSGESLRLWRVLDVIFQRRGATPADRRQPAIAPASYVQDHIRLCGAMAGPPLRSGPPGDLRSPGVAYWQPRALVRKLAALGQFPHQSSWRQTGHRRGAGSILAQRSEATGESRLGIDAAPRRWQRGVGDLRHRCIRTARKSL